MANPNIAATSTQAATPPRPVYTPEYTDTEDPFGVTVLRSAAWRPKRLAKRFLRDGTVLPYDRAYLFSAMTVRIPDIEAAAYFLRELQDRPDRAVVAGALLPGANPDCTIRRTQDDHANGVAATFKDTPRHLAPFDFDKLPIPEGLDPTDARAVTEYLRGMLPPCFHPAACVGVLTSSHLVVNSKLPTPTICARLWFQLDTPLLSLQLKRWIAPLCEAVDPALFHAIQLNYTARAQFENPYMNPVKGGRVVRLSGAPQVHVPDHVPLIKPEPFRFVPDVKVRMEMWRRNAHRNLTHHLTKLRVCPVGTRYPTMKAACMALAGHVVCGQLNEERVRTEILRVWCGHGGPADKVLRMWAWALNFAADQIGDEEGDATHAVELAISKPALAEMLRAVEAAHV